MCRSLLIACSSITLPDLILWPLTGIPVGLKCADSLAQQDQDTGAGLYWAIWGEATRGYHPCLPPSRPIALVPLQYSPS